jgi:hypothetical protein
MWLRPGLVCLEAFSMRRQRGLVHSPVALHFVQNAGIFCEHLLCSGRDAALRGPRSLPADTSASTTVATSAMPCRPCQAVEQGDAIEHFVGVCLRRRGWRIVSRDACDQQLAPVAPCIVGDDFC